MTPDEISVLSARLDRDLPDVVRYGTFPAWDDVRCLFAEIDRQQTALEQIYKLLDQGNVDADDIVGLAVAVAMRAMFDRDQAWETINQIERDEASTEAREVRAAAVDLLVALQAAETGRNESGPRWRTAAMVAALRTFYGAMAAS